jgi:hypothetical protein
MKRGDVGLMPILQKSSQNHIVWTPKNKVQNTGLVFSLTDEESHIGGFFLSLSALKSILRDHGLEIRRKIQKKT